MVDMLLSLTLFFLAHQNANAGQAQYKPGQMPPQSNQWVCTDPHYARGNSANRDLCDRQGGYTGR